MNTHLQVFSSEEKFEWKYAMILLEFNSFHSNKKTSTYSHNV